MSKYLVTQPLYRRVRLWRVPTQLLWLLAKLLYILIIAVLSSLLFTTCKLFVFSYWPTQQRPTCFYYSKLLTAPFCGAMAKWPPFRETFFILRFGKIRFPFCESSFILRFVKIRFLFCETFFDLQFAKLFAFCQTSFVLRKEMHQMLWSACCVLWARCRLSRHDAIFWSTIIPKPCRICFCKL